MGTLRLFFLQIIYFLFFSKHSELSASLPKRCLLRIFFCACLFSDFSRALNITYRYGKTSVEMLRNKKDAPSPMDDSLFRDKVVAIDKNQVRLRRSEEKSSAVEKKLQLHAE